MTTILRLSILLLGMTVVGCFADTLSPGSDAPVCVNTITPGAVQSCKEGRDVALEPLPLLIQEKPLIPVPNFSVVAPDSEHAPAHDGRPELRANISIGGVTEKEVDKFLENWGKPPREAVRALMNPTEQNIRALVERHKRDEVIRTYMAQRMATMIVEDNPTGKFTPRDVYTVIPRLVGIKMILYVTPDCTNCDDAIASIKQLALDYPIVTTHVSLIAESEASVVQTMLRWQLTLPTSTVSATEAKARKLTHVPLFEIVDTRNQNSVRLSGVRTPAEVVAAAMALRNARDPNTRSGTQNNS